MLDSLVFLLMKTFQSISYVGLPAKMLNLQLGCFRNSELKKKSFHLMLLKSDNVLSDLTFKQMLLFNKESEIYSETSVAKIVYFTYNSNFNLWFFINLPLLKIQHDCYFISWESERSCVGPSSFQQLFLSLLF